MAKSKAPSVLEISAELKKGKLKPVYYLFGEDGYSLSNTLKEIEETIKPQISSEFDHEVFYGDNSDMNKVLDLASAFPFGSGKKFLVLKETEKVTDKKPLKSYAAYPADFTTIVFVHNGTITNLNTEPFKTLAVGDFLFEAKELKGKFLLSWLVKHVSSLGKNISEEDAQVLIDMVGEDRQLIEAQLEKIFIFLKDKRDITTESILSLSSFYKQFTIFDLQNALGRKEKDKALEIGLNLVDNGAEMPFIVAMLTRYYTSVARIGELLSKNTPDTEIARTAGVPFYFVKDYIRARKIYSDNQMRKVFRTLLNTDLATKTTSTDTKTLLVLLITEMLSD
jgi:DNA polymerase III subunit delta